MEVIELGKRLMGSNNAKDGACYSMHRILEVLVKAIVEGVSIPSLETGCPRAKDSTTTTRAYSSHDLTLLITSNYITTILFMEGL